MSLRKREAVIFAVLTAAAAVGTLVSFFSGRPETSAPVFAGMEHYGQLALSDPTMGRAVWNTLWPFLAAAAAAAVIVLPVKRLLSRRVTAVSAGWWDLCMLTVSDAGANRLGSCAAITAALLLCFLLWGGEQFYTYIRSRKNG